METEHSKPKHAHMMNLEVLRQRQLERQRLQIHFPDESHRRHQICLLLSSRVCSTSLEGQLLLHSLLADSLCHVCCFELVRVWAAQVFQTFVPQAKAP